MTGHGKDTYDVHANYTTYVSQHHHLAMANPDAGTALSFDDYTAQHSASRLGTDASDLSAEVGNIDAAPGTVFGLSAMGQKLQREADLAHGKLKGAVDLLASAMDSYSSAVTAAKRTFIDTDDEAGSSMTAIQQSLNAGDTNVTTPTAAAPTMTDKQDADGSTTDGSSGQADTPADTPPASSSTPTQPGFPTFNFNSSLPGLQFPLQPSNGGE